MMDVFLADDEVMARIFLKELLGDQDLRFGVCIAGEAENGEQLLGLLEKKRPDLVFVDIRMPLCDGLEVIRRANARYRGIQWVIVSGFSEFAYAREAVRLGVIEYLLKPVESEDLTRVLEKAEQVLDVRTEEANARWEQAGLEQLSTDPDLEGFGDAMCSDGKRLLMCRIDLEGDVDGDLENRLLERLRSGLAPFRSRDDRAAALPLGASAILTICTTTGIEDLGSREIAVKRAAIGVLREVLDGEAAARWNLCSSGFIDSERIAGAYADLGRKALLRFTVGLNRELDSDPDARDDGLFVRLGLSAKAMADSIGRDSIPPSAEDMDRFFALVGKVPPAAFPGAFNALKDYFSFRIGDGMETLDSVADPAALAGVLGEISRDLRRASSGSDSADRILDYVERHYREDIGVNTVADRFGLTPSYVSSLFKKRTGTTFVRFLAERRISEAKDLLLNRPELPLREISASIGYRDPRYFSRIFRRYVGEYPSEYRKKG